MLSGPKETLCFPSGVSPPEDVRVLTTRTVCTELQELEGDGDHREAGKDSPCPIKLAKYFLKNSESKRKSREY